MTLDPSNPSHLPEVVARPGVVAARVGGGEARVDADEDDVQALPQVVGQAPGAQLLLGEASVLVLELHISQYNRCLCLH